MIQYVLPKYIPTNIFSANSHTHCVHSSQELAACKESEARIVAERNIQYDKSNSLLRESKKREDGLLGAVEAIQQAQKLTVDTIGDLKSRLETQTGINTATFTKLEEVEQALEWQKEKTRMADNRWHSAKAQLKAAGSEYIHYSPTSPSDGDVELRDVEKQYSSPPTSPVPPTATDKA